jgi:hypothetical protein
MIKFIEIKINQCNQKMQRFFEKYEIIQTQKELIDN